MNTERLHRLPSYREVQAKRAAEELAQLNRRGYGLPEPVAYFNGNWDPVQVEEPAPKPTEAPAEQPEPVERQKFRKGDRLLCVNPGDNGQLTRGKTYAVVEDASTSFVDVVNDNGKATTYFTSRFQLAPAEAPAEAPSEAPSETPTEQPAFRTGDRLVCVDNECKEGLTLGSTYLAERDSRRGCVRVRDDTRCLQTYFVERFKLAS